MNSIFTAAAKSLVFGFAIVVFMTLSQGVARAETVTIHGITLGSFNNSLFSSNETLLGLTFNGTAFPNPIGTVDTSAPSFTPSASSLNLGSFSLTDDPATYTGNTFALQLTFSFLTPSSLLELAGSSQPSFTASLTGVVQSAADGSLTIDFNNAPSIFTVSLDGNVISTFSIVVDDIVILPGETAKIVGTITQGSEVPEPMTLLMLSGGLAGARIVLRKRRKTSA